MDPYRHGHDHLNDCGDGGHDHSHDGRHHSHEASEESYAARRHPESVVLEIGGDIGALIVHTDASMLGVEVEISPTGQDDRRTHKDVLEREISGHPAYTAVFDGLREGTYTLWVGDVARARGVTVGGAAVAQLEWAGAS
jgi:hypothetical protein